MYDVNPLGPLMHLKELERRSLRAPRAGAPLRLPISAWFAAAVKRLIAACASKSPAG